MTAPTVDAQIALPTLPARPRRFRELAAWVSGGLLVALAVLAVVVPLFSSESRSTVNLARALQSPVYLGGSWDHVLGTDQLGRDVLLQSCYALRLSVLVASVSVLLAGTIGVLMGLVSGYVGGWVDAIIGQLTAAQMALPFLVVAMTLAIVTGASLTTVVVAIALQGWVPFARLVRSEALGLRDREFVLLAKVSGVKSSVILVRHLLPNVLPSVVVLATQQMAIAVIEESSLSFLGLGVQPPQMSLGSMLGQTRVLLQTNAWLPLTPILTLVILSLSVNILGDRFRRSLTIR